MQRILILILLIVPKLVWAEFVPETATVETLPDHKGQGWFWAAGWRMPNETDGRAFLFDAKGETLGQLSTGLWFNSMVPANKRGEIITVETYFDRGTRGNREDLVVTYDAQTLSPVSEVSIPTKRMHAVRSSGLATLTEDEKFLLVVNYTPAQSISVVDLDKQEFVAEIDTSGCSVIYTAGNRDFYSICGNGGFLHIRLDDTGNVSLLERTPPIFDPVDDFLTISASRIGDTWFFVSRENNVYAINMQPDSISLQAKWPLANTDEQEDGWMISGFHHTAAHQSSERLFVLMHQGEHHTFEEPGTHVWVYDTKSGTKVSEIELEDLAFSISVNQDGPARLYSLAVHIPMPFVVTILMVVLEGVEGIGALVKQVANIYDADSGEHLVKTGFLPEGLTIDIQAW